MSNVDTFKQYASQIDLSPAQLEAVTDCFQACFEADEGEQADNGSEHAATETPDTTAPSEARQPHESFSDAGGNYGSIAADEETRQRTMRWQNFLNKKLGLNLAVDGKWGKNTAAAYKQYLETKNKA